MEAMLPPETGSTGGGEIGEWGALRSRICAGCASLAALSMGAAAAYAETYTGGTDQPGKREIRVQLNEAREVSAVEIDWIAPCRRGGSVRETTTVTDFDRTGLGGFAAAVKERGRDGRTKFKTRYVLWGKREDRNSFFGTFRSSGRYKSPGEAWTACRTRKVRWAARVPFK